MKSDRTDSGPPPPSFTHSFRHKNESWTALEKDVSCMTRWIDSLNPNLCLQRRSFQYQPLWAGWIKSEVYFKYIYVLSVCLERPVAPREKEKTSIDSCDFLFTLHYVCTYRLVFSPTFHPYQSLSMSSLYTDWLPFPSCLLRISQTGFKKDFHKCPLLQILHSPLYVLRASSILTVKVTGGDLGI